MIPYRPQDTFGDICYGTGCGIPCVYPGSHLYAVGGIRLSRIERDGLQKFGVCGRSRADCVEDVCKPRGVTAFAKTYSFRVSSNPSTGYEWFLLQQGDTAVAAFRGNAMESEETPDQAELQSPKKGEFSSVPVSVGSSAGRGGWERWTFQAFGEGQSVIVLGYCRPWETEVSPARYHLFSLLVR